MNILPTTKPLRHKGKPAKNKPPTPTMSPPRTTTTTTQNRRLPQKALLWMTLWLSQPAAAQQVLTLTSDTWRAHVDGKSVLIKFDEPMVRGV